MYRIIKFLVEKKKLSLKRISDILFEKGYRSVRTKSVLRSNYIHSIYKKGKIREEMRKGIEKDKILNEEDAELIQKFIKKLLKEIN